MDSLKSTLLSRTARATKRVVPELALALVSLTALAADAVTDRGFAHTVSDAALVAKSIDGANLVLAAQSIRLRPSWKEVAGSKDATPVYLVASKPNALTTPAAVPDDCSCIFVNPLALRRWVAAQTGGSGQLSIDRGNLLEYMLLHEAGHLKSGTSGVSFVNGSLSMLNVDRTIAKRDEERADEFAANAVRQALAAKPPSDTSLTATWIANELSKLSWNMQAQRTLNEFGSAATGKPSVYFDASYEHPNLAWRILRTNDMIHQTPSTRALLDAFEASRQRGVAAASTPIVP